MGFWNYRVILKDDHRSGSGPRDVGTTTPQYAIHEVFYNDQGEAWACTEDPVSAAGDTLAELTEDLEHYRQALERPVLAYEDFPNEEAMPAGLARDDAGELIALEDLKAEFEGAGDGETGETGT